MSRTINSAVVAGLVAANPHQQLKAVEFGTLGELCRVEWYALDERHTTPAEDGGNNRQEKKPSDSQ